MDGHNSDIDLPVLHARRTRRGGNVASRLRVEADGVLQVVAWLERSTIHRAIAALVMLVALWPSDSRAVTPRCGTGHEDE
jgi:hypothetical protein